MKFNYYHNHTSYLEVYIYNCSVLPTLITENNMHSVYAIHSLCFKIKLSNISLTIFWTFPVSIDLKQAFILQTASHSAWQLQNDSTRPIICNKNNFISYWMTGVVSVCVYTVAGVSRLLFFPFWTVKKSFRLI